jgi:oxygen-independent coproporphyrinogen-3 oxidase
VLAILDRTHDPEGVPRAVRWAREAGFDQVSLDLIYGTPGESLDDWATSVDAALACEPDHVSAYSLVVEQGTALARRVRRGEVAPVDDDDLADKYVLVDERLAAAGLHWYEVSNWARDDGARCRHNLGYWRGDDWWGVGPGAHSHRDGVRWWNVKHPAEYARRLDSGESPAAGREELSADERHVEALLLGIRLAEGLPVAVLSGTERTRLGDLAGRGLLEVSDERVTLTRQGRLLADGVVRDLLD